MPVITLSSIALSVVAARAGGAHATLRQVDTSRHRPARDAMRSIALAIERARLRCLVARAASTSTSTARSIR